MVKGFSRRTLRDDRDDIEQAFVPYWDRHGVISFVAAHRTHEIGIRMALGATRASAVWLIARDALVMIGTGIAIALPCLWALSRFIDAQLFGVRAVDGPTIAGASALLGLVAIASAMLPAWRAASVSPTKALRYE